MKMGGYIIAQQLQTCGHKESQGIVVISQNHLYHTPGSSDFDPSEISSICHQQENLQSWNLRRAQISELWKVFLAAKVCG
jgi:hypothetical protein